MYTRAVHLLFIGFDHHERECEARPLIGQYTLSATLIGWWLTEVRLVFPPMIKRPTDGYWANIEMGSPFCLCIIRYMEYRYSFKMRQKGPTLSHRHWKYVLGSFWTLLRSVYWKYRFWHKNIFIHIFTWINYNKD